MLYVLLKDSQVLNVLWTDDLNFVKVWVRSYFNNEIESLKYCPLNKKEKSVDYIIEETPDSYCLVKALETVNSGYIYDTTELLQEKVSEVKWLEFNGKADCVDWGCDYIHSTNLMFDNNKRILRRLDGDTIYKIMDKIHQIIQTKVVWNREEYVHVVSQIIRDFGNKIAKQFKLD